MVRLSEKGKQELDALVKEFETEAKIPGFVLAVSNASEQLYASAGGHVVHDDPSSARVTPDTVFWLCSMSKLYTSIAGLQLVERGLLNLSDSITKYIPTFTKEVPVVIQGVFTPTPTSVPAKAVPTVGSLFNHSSGLSYFVSADKPAEPYGLSKGYTYDYKGLSLEEGQEKYLELLKEGWSGIPLGVEPGTNDYSYGFSLDVLGIIIERVTGQSLAEYCAENIFKPLRLSTTTFELTPELNDRLLPLTFRNPDGSIARWDNHTKLTQRFPDPVVRALGGIGAYSSLPDHLTILRHILQIHDGTPTDPNTQPILKPQTVKELMFAPTLSDVGAAGLSFLVNLLEGDAEAKSGLNHSHGFALVTKEEGYKGRRPAGTGFWSGWAGMHYIVDPTNGLAIVSGTQIIPTMDKGSVELFRKAEEIVYANLEE